jgi:hypothetical protein
MAAGLQIPGIEPAFKPQTTGLDKAMEMMGKASSTTGSMQQNIPMPGKTIGGGLTAGLSGAAAGTMIAGGPGIGTAIGGIVGTAGYYLA